MDQPLAARKELLRPLYGRIKPGEQTLLCTVFTDAAGALPDRIPEEVIRLAGLL